MVLRCGCEEEEGERGEGERERERENTTWKLMKPQRYKSVWVQIILMQHAILSPIHCMHTRSTVIQQQSGKWKETLTTYALSISPLNRTNIYHHTRQKVPTLTLHVFYSVIQCDSTPSPHLQWSSTRGNRWTLQWESNEYKMLHVRMCNTVV